jgi:hypothetical protein
LHLKNDHISKVFTPDKPVSNSNQHSYRLNFLSEFISTQIKQNETIQHNLKSVVSTIDETRQEQEQKMDQIILHQQYQNQQSDQYIKKVSSQEKTNDEILLNIQQLTENHIEFGKSLQNEQLINQAILDQLNFQDQQLRETNKQLENYVTLATKLSEQLINQENILKEMEQKLLIQDIYHSTVMSKLENQEALNEKIIRQLDHLKSIIYERVTLIVDKVEHSFQSTSEYFHEIFTKAGFTKPFLLSGRPKEKKLEEETNQTMNS